MSQDLLRRPASETWKWWIGLLAPPLIWGARLLAGWAIGEIACKHGWAAGTLYYSVQTAIVAIALAVVVISGWAAVKAFRVQDGGGWFDPEDPLRFLALSGVLSSVIFGLLVVVEGSAIYVVSC